MSGAENLNPLLWAGYREHRRTRSTGTLVVLVDAYEQGVTSPPDVRWALICDDHSGVIQFERQAEARAFLSHPEEWCPTCMGFDDPNGPESNGPLALGGPRLPPRRRDPDQRVYARRPDVGPSLASERSYGFGQPAPDLCGDWDLDEIETGENRYRSPRRQRVDEWSDLSDAVVLLDESDLLGWQETDGIRALIEAAETGPNLARPPVDGALVRRRERTFERAERLVAPR